jgi:hypothetical protein
VRLGCVFQLAGIRTRIRIRNGIRNGIRIRTRRLEAWGYTNKAHLRGLNKIS